MPAPLRGFDYDIVGGHGTPGRLPRWESAGAPDGAGGTLADSHLNDQITGNYLLNLIATLTGNRDVIFPDSNATLAALNLAQTWTASQKIRSSTSPVLETISNGANRLLMSQYGGAGTYTGRRAGGTEATPAAVLNGNVISALVGEGYDGASWIEAANVALYAAGAISSGIVPGAVSFSTRNLAGAYSERMRLTSEGLLGVGTINPGYLIEAYKDQNAATQITVTNTANDTGAYARLQAYGGANLYATLGYFAANYTGVSYYANKAVLQAGSSTGGFVFDDRSANGFQFLTSGTERARITNAGMSIGTGAAPVYPLQVTNPAGTGASTISIDAYGNIAQLVGRRAQGTLASPTAATDGITALGLAAQGYDGSTFRNVAAIQAEINGGPSGTDVPGRWSFYTHELGDATGNVNKRFQIAGDAVQVWSQAATGDPVLRLRDVRSIVWSGKEEMGVLDWYTADANTGGLGTMLKVASIQDKGYSTLPGMSLAMYARELTSDPWIEGLRMTHNGRVIVGFDESVYPTSSPSLDDAYTLITQKFNVEGSGEVFDPSILSATELVTNGDFSSATGWTATNATLNVGTGQGVDTKTSTTVNNYRLHQAVTTVIGKRYRVTATFYGTLSSLNNEIDLRVGTTVAGVQNFYGRKFDSLTADYTFTADFIATGTTTYITFYGITVNVTDLAVMVWDNVSCKEVIGGDLITRGNVTARTFQPSALADADAPNNSIYYSTTASRLVYKDSGGLVNALY